MAYQLLLALLGNTSNQKTVRIMADILEHPRAFAKEKAWEFKDGSKVWIEAPPGGHLTVCEAIYMLDDVKFRIHSMMRAESD